MAKAAIAALWRSIAFASASDMGAPAMAGSPETGEREAGGEGAPGDRLRLHGQASELK
jgi:hypothetical protein